MTPTLPDLGVGIGYRTEIHDQIMANRRYFDWIEIVTDLYIHTPDAVNQLRSLRDSYVVVPHGLEMSIGSDSPLDHTYLEQVAAVASAVDAPWVSDHLCFTREVGIELGNLAPVVRTRAKARSIAANAQRVQDRLGRPFLLENITYYVELPGQLTESEMINEVLEHCDCGLLLDLNNVMINARNYGFDPYHFLDSLPLERVVQLHLAGTDPTNDHGAFLFDGHDAAISDDVFSLLKYLVARHKPHGVMIERDNRFPEDFREILADVARIRSTMTTGTRP